MQFRSQNKGNFLNGNKAENDFSSHSPSVLVILASIATTITVLSQISNVNLTFFYGIGWVIVAAFCLNNSGSKIIFRGFSLIFAIGLLAFAFYCCVCYLVTGEPGYIRGHFIAVLKTALLYIVGMVFAAYGLGNNELRSILFVYVTVTVIYSTWVLINYIPSFTTWLNSEVYFFPQKNSFGQVAGVGAICAAAIKARTKGGDLLRWAVYAYLVFVIAAVQCRTALLGCIVGTMVVLCVSGKRKFASLR